MGTSNGLNGLKWKQTWNSKKRERMKKSIKNSHKLPSSHLIYVKADSGAEARKKRQMFGANIQCYNVFGLTNEMTKAMILHTMLICLLTLYSGFGICIFFWVLWTKILDGVLLWHCWTSVFVLSAEHWEYRNNNKHLCNHQLNTESTWSTWWYKLLFNSRSPLQFISRAKHKINWKRKTITDATIECNHI